MAHMGRHYERRTFLKLALTSAGVLLSGQASCLQAGPLPPGATESRFERTPSQTMQPVEQTTDGRAVVAIVRGDDPAATVRQAVSLAGGFGQVVHRGDTVLVKPNLTIPSASGLGNVTDSRVVQATIELCQEAGASRVQVGDGCGGDDTEAIMRQAGYGPVLEATGATFVDFNRDDIVTLYSDNPLGLPEYYIDRIAAEAPVLFSLAVLKVHNEAIVSLACKNLVGITARKVYGSPRQRLHDAGSQRVIADLVRLRTPDFAVIDGTVGLEGDSPMHGTPVPWAL